MRIVVIGDIHNDVENLIQLLDKVGGLKPDVIVFSGDLIDVGVDLRGFTRVDIANLVLEELNVLNVPVLAVPGNQDKSILSLLEERGISIHGVGRDVNGVGFYGFGGAKTPFGTPLEPEEEELNAGLRGAHESIKREKIKVQVTHAPPHNTKLDIITSGAHVGSRVVRRIIEELSPNAAICAHIHEARGVDFIGSTKIVNAGRFPEGYCGVVDIDLRASTTKAEVVNLI